MLLFLLAITTAAQSKRQVAILVETDRALDDLQSFQDVVTAGIMRTQPTKYEVLTKSIDAVRFDLKRLRVNVRNAQSTAAMNQCLPDLSRVVTYYQNLSDQFDFMKPTVDQLASAHLRAMDVSIHKIADYFVGSAAPKAAMRTARVNTDMEGTMQNVNRFKARPIRKL